MCFATIFLLRQGVQMPLQFWSFRFGCGLAALRRIADFQSANAAQCGRPAEYNSAIQQIENLRYGPRHFLDSFDLKFTGSRCRA
jgi:hypothetical protein